MSPQRLTQTSKQIRQYLIVIVGLMLWLLSSGVSITHAHEHTFIEEHHCQLCVIAENSSEAASHHTALFNVEPFTFIFTTNKVTTAFITPRLLSNRDPPVSRR